MSNKSFTRAWYDWLRTPCPVANFRNGKVGALTYGVEHDLDHLASNVSRLGQSVIERVEWDYPKLASEELNAITAIETELESLAVTEEERDEYKRYILATRSLLEAVSTLDPQRLAIAH